MTGLGRNPENGGPSRHVVVVIDGKGRGLETGGAGIGAVGETGLGTGIAAEMAGVRLAEEVEANRKGHGHRSPIKG